MKAYLGILAFSALVHVSLRAEAADPPPPAAAPDTATPATTAAAPDTASPAAAGDAEAAATPPAAPEAAPNAAAEAPPEAPTQASPEAPPKPEEADYGHGGQFGIRAAITGGYRMVLRYDDSSFCAKPDPEKTTKDQQKFCGHAAPAGLDLALSYAIADFAEPFVWLRLGLSGEDQTKTEPLKIIGAGIRVYTMSDSAFKVFVEPALGFEFEKGAPEGGWLVNDPEYKQDLVFHVAVGPQFDIGRNIGIFLDGGLTVGVLRAVHSSLELKAGLQLRAP